MTIEKGDTNNRIFNLFLYELKLNRFLRYSFESFILKINIINEFVILII